MNTSQGIQEYSPGNDEFARDVSLARRGSGSDIESPSMLESLSGLSGASAGIPEASVFRSPNGTVEIHGGQFEATGGHRIHVTINTGSGAGEVKPSKPLSKETSKPTEMHLRDENAREIGNTSAGKGSTGFNGHEASFTPGTPPVQSSCDIYFRHLAVKGRGSPLYIPGPNKRLPKEYQRTGLRIGDVGIITAAGSFDFLFNICHPHDHPFNYQGVPNGFEQLLIDPTDIQEHSVFDPESYIASASIKKSYPKNGSCGLAFQSSASEGAILTMPVGSSSEDVGNGGKFRKYAETHAENWYLYANNIRDRDAKNGDVRLATGYDKTSLWGIAIFADSTANQDTVFVEFQPVDGANVGKSYQWKHSGTAEVRSGPTTKDVEALRRDDPERGDAYENQCLFLRSLNVTLQEKAWKKLFAQVGEAEVNGESSNMPCSQSSRPSTPNQGCLASSGHANPATLHPSSVPGAVYGTCTSLSVFSDLPSGGIGESVQAHVSRTITALGGHPSEALNKMLLEHFPSARMAITEDRDWISVLTEEDSDLPHPEDLCARIMTSFTVCCDEGTAFIGPKNRKESKKCKASEGRPLTKLSRPKRVPLACRFVSQDQWFLTHIPPTSKINRLKQVILAKCHNLPYDPWLLLQDDPEARPPSPITFAPVTEGLGGVGLTDGERLFSSFSVGGAPEIPIPTDGYTLIRFSTGQILEDDLPLVWYNLEPYELVELHTSTPPATFALTKALFQPGKTDDSSASDPSAGGQVDTLIADTFFNPPSGGGVGKKDPKNLREEGIKVMKLTPLPRHDINAYVRPYWEGWVRTLRGVLRVLEVSSGAPRSQSRLEWKERWVVIRNGMLHVHRARMDSKPTHSFPLMSLISIQGVEHALEVIKNKSQTNQSSQPQTQPQIQRGSRVATHTLGGREQGRGMSSHWDEGGEEGGKGNDEEKGRQKQRDGQRTKDARERVRAAGRGGKKERERERGGEKGMARDLEGEKDRHEWERLRSRGGRVAEKPSMDRLSSKTKAAPNRRSQDDRSYLPSSKEEAEAAGMHILCAKFIHLRDKEPLLSARSMMGSTARYTSTGPTLAGEPLLPPTPVPTSSVQDFDANTYSRFQPHYGPHSLSNCDSPLSLPLSPSATRPHFPSPPRHRSVFRPSASAGASLSLPVKTDEGTLHPLVPQRKSSLPSLGLALLGGGGGREQEKRWFANVCIPFGDDKGNEQKRQGEKDRKTKEKERKQVGKKGDEGTLGWTLGVGRIHTQTRSRSKSDAMLMFAPSPSNRSTTMSMDSHSGGDIETNTNIPPPPLLPSISLPLSHSTCPPFFPSLPIHSHPAHPCLPPVQLRSHHAQVPGPHSQLDLYSSDDPSTRSGSLMGLGSSGGVVGRYGGTVMGARSDVVENVEGQEEEWPEVYNLNDEEKMRFWKEQEREREKRAGAVVMVTTSTTISSDEGSFPLPPPMVGVPSTLAEMGVEMVINREARSVGSPRSAVSQGILSLESVDGYFPPSPTPPNSEVPVGQTSTGGSKPPASIERIRTSALETAGNRPSSPCSSSSLSSPVFAHSSDESSDWEGDVGGRGDSRHHPHHNPKTGRARAGYRFGGRVAQPHQSSQAHAPVGPDVGSRSGEEGESPAEERRGKWEKERERVDSRQERKPKIEKGEWIVLDMGNDTAFNNILRVLHYEFPSPVASTFMSQVGLELGMFDTQTPPSKPTEAQPYGMPDTPMDADAESEAERLSKTKMERTLQAKGPDHQAILTPIVPQSFTPAETGAGVTYAHIALPYPEWRVDLVRRARMCGMREAGRPLDVAEGGGGFTTEGQGWGGLRGSIKACEKQRARGAKGEKKGEVVKKGSQHAHLSAVRPGKDKAKGKGKENASTATGSEAEDEFDDYDSPFEVAYEEDEGDCVERDTVLTDFAIRDSEEESETEWVAWLADLPRQMSLRGGVGQVEKGKSLEASGNSHYPLHRTLEHHHRSQDTFSSASFSNPLYRAHGDRFGFPFSGRDASSLSGVAMEATSSTQGSYEFGLNPRGDATMVAAPSTQGSHGFGFNQSQIYMKGRGHARAHSKSLSMPFTHYRKGVDGSPPPPHGQMLRTRFSDLGVGSAKGKESDLIEWEGAQDNEKGKEPTTSTSGVPTVSHHPIPSPISQDTGASSISGLRSKARSLLRHDRSQSGLRAEEGTYNTMPMVATASPSPGRGRSEVGMSSRSNVGVKKRKGAAAVDRIARGLDSALDFLEGK